MTIRNLDLLLAPRSVALIGASVTPGSVGLKVAENLLSGGFKGPVHFVNRKYAEVLGRRCFPTVADLPAPPDLAVIATPPPTVPELVAELGRIGTRAVVIITAGIGEEIRQPMLDAARPYCLRIQGPNCLGLMVPGIGLNASFVRRAPLAGELAFVSQSGALITAVVEWACERGIGFSHIVSLGDMADADFGDFLDYLAGDTKSRAILLYMEAVTAAPKFLSAARRAARAKPVIVIKAGRHIEGARAARSHTGALAGADAAYEASFRRAGLLRVLELDELFGAAEVLARAPRLLGERLAILTNGGGAGVLAADRLADFGGRLAPLAPETIKSLDAMLPRAWSHGNPVDIVGDAGPERFGTSLDVLMEDATTDAILVLDCPTALASSTEAAKAVVGIVAKHRASGREPKPVLTNWLGDGVADEARRLFASARIPTFQTPDAAVRGFMQLVGHARAQTELMRTPSSLPHALKTDPGKVRSIIQGVTAAGRRMLSEIEAKSLLLAYGIPTVETEIAADPGEAGRKARALLERCDAVVLKILSDDITHKSDVGGVRLGLASVSETLAAAEAMLVRVRAAAPGAFIRGFTVQPMIRRPHAYELLIGMSDDATFGPVLMFGAGGTAVEVLKDTALALPPLDFDLACDLMRHTRIFSLLEGFRDRPQAKLDAIAEAIVCTSHLIVQHPEILELDINPLLADEDGVIALDARVRVAGEGEAKRCPLAIRPYPAEWEAEWTAPGLGDILLRPIRPDDEPAFAELLNRLTPDDMRLRFFTPRIDLSHKHIARFTQIDYAREMAFVAVAKDSGQIFGAARLAADPDYTRGEYGVIVRSDLKGRGLGWRLMRHLIDYASREGLQELFGSVLAENTTMLRMCAELGFSIASDPADPTLRLVRLELGRAPTATKA
jgi:acetyltransferase